MNLLVTKVSRWVFVQYLIVLPFTSLSPSFGFPQSVSITGHVIDSISGEPVVQASVYVNNSSIGSVTNKDGRFTIHTIASGAYTLVVSCIGYQTTFIEVNADSKNVYSIYLQREIPSLKEIVVTKAKSKTRKKWEDRFIAEVIGTSSFAKSSIIKNKAALQFSYEPSTATLTAHCSEPLIIENPLIGYTIYYSLQRFSCSDSTGEMSYAGYSLYREMQGDHLQQEKWRKNRLAVYDISLLKFFRSLYNGTSEKEGYRLYWPNSVSQKKEVLVGISGMNRVFTQGVAFTTVDTTIIPGDSICRRTDEGFCELKFSYPLVIARTKESIVNTRLVKEYAGQKWDEVVDRYRGTSLGLHADDLNELHRISSVLFPDKKSIVNVMRNGYYTRGTELYVKGLFGWTEKLATMLPLDYWP